jgi:hypothetical protein
MRINPNRTSIAVTVSLMMVMFAGAAVAQQPKSMVANVSGEGTIKFGKEEFKIHAVVVKLFEDGKAEINLITDITVFVTGSWSRGDEAEKSLYLKITGSTVSGTLDGGGKMLLTDDRKSIAGLHLEVFNKTTKKHITADFTAK